MGGIDLKNRERFKDELIEACKDADDSCITDLKKYLKNE